MKQADVFYQAMLARDPRFDGKFFVGVKTTGIYCRPICPAKPKFENVEFFPNHFAAEKSGYRPCLRCRPESAPRSPAWVGKSAIVQRALRVMHTQETIFFDEDKFAEQFGVSARHLRRVFTEEIGKTPKQLAFENRLNLAQKLTIETALPITQVAFASGFASVRRFNDAFKDRFTKTPREIRRHKVATNQGLQISLSYRPPFDFEGLMRSYQNHRVGNLEWFTEGTMHRVISFNGQAGTIEISNDEQKSALRLKIDFPDTMMIHAIANRVRNLFDLDSDPVVIANALEVDTKLKKLLRKTPGIRLPSGWDPFEIAIATILGQLVSVAHGRALVHDLIELAGKEIEVTTRGAGPRKIKLFPTPQAIVTADLAGLKTTRIRKQTLIDFSRALLENRISLEPTQDVEQFVAAVRSIRGIGPWTAQYMALKVLRNTDSFPDSDLVLARALEEFQPAVIEKMSPWRGYVAALLWRGFVAPTQSVRKEKKMNCVQLKMDSPIGPLFLVSSDEALHGVFWQQQAGPYVEQTPGAKDSRAFQILQKTIAQLTEYFQGSRREFDLPLDAKGTEFQKRVWIQLRQIEYGETQSYKQIAIKLTHPNASRAVGTANGRNPISIIIPCHRVISSDGTLGGYAGGLAIKEKLLSLERASIRRSAYPISSQLKITNTIR